MGHPEVTFSQKILISHGRHYKGNKANGLTVAELNKKNTTFMYINIYKHFLTSRKKLQLFYTGLGNI